MATNWAKDGLDAYLALTGEKRADDKAKADAEYQKQTMQLAQNQDKRAAVTSGLTDQKLKQELDDNAKWDKLLFEKGVEKETANPFTPTAETIKDPAKVEMSKYVYGNSLKTAQYARETVGKTGNISIPASQISTAAPSYVGETAKHIFGPAAAKRAGQESVDPVTGKKGILTGNMGYINLETDPSGEVYLSGDLEVKNEDGTIRYAPFTNGTDDPTQPVKRMPLSALEHEANAVIKGIDDAVQTGADPAVTITKRKLAGMESWPRELKKKYYEGIIEHEKNIRTRESDVETTKKIGEELKKVQPEIDALDWKGDPHGAAAQLYSLLSEKGKMNTAEVEKATTRIISSKVPAEKKLNIEEIGAGGEMVQKAIIGSDGKITPVGKTYRKHALPSGGADSTPAKTKEIEHLVKNGMDRDEAVSLVYGRTKQADAITAKYFGILSKENAEKVGTSDYKTDDQLMEKAEQMADKERRKKGPAAKGIAPAAADFDLTNNKPSRSSMEMIMGLNGTL